MKHALRASLLAVAVVLATSAAAQAATPNGNPGHRVPFHMDLAGADRPLDMAPGMPPFLDRSTFGGRCSVPSDWMVTIDSAGTAEHLGAVKVLQVHCTVFDFLGAPPQLGVFADGVMTITAANGDELWVRYAGSFLFTPEGRPDVGTSVLSYGPMTIVGGTGRFASATGAFTGSAVDAFGSGGNTAHFDGWIAYSASDSADA